VVTNFIFRSATVSSILVTGWILPSNTKNTTQTGASSPPAVAPLDPVDRGTDTPSSRGVAWHRRSLQRSGSQHRASPKQYYTPRLFSMPALMASADPRSPSPTSGPDRVPTDCSRAARAASRRSGRPRPMVLPRGGAPATYRKPGGTRCPGVPEQGVPVAQVVRNGHLRERPTDSNPWWHVAATGGNRLAWRAPDPVLAVRAPFDLGFRCAISHSWILRPTAARLVSVSCVPSRRGQPAIWPTCSQQHSPME
jgi:hypothetical protein